ncbi:MAG: dihydroorotase [Phenylobacterium sp.]|jgi:dihydroorotase|uniref:dihydroorotase n=1 Tax=Phenylobacterium sp. TaxID=1871053 RepID=UPI00271EA2B4|nr:dihydroorotase [Phenylobacterium sp.]MDO8912013.1 dihydroorotase [Phenylobacterium sp.]MDP2010599.1 dihydroorotase [Phenylobacterium sp.]MDP3102053.1 dihydroorotase [Phenylobacterium sp.]MDP3869039.1 dihydroorotase [Phenylobacterium sp.]HQT54569.1 dihydroorotase [Phenylobacterium sp.]
MSETYDLIIRGGEVVNHAGRGLSDVGVRGGKIVAIGDLSQASAGEVFDAKGLAVLPGVIDTQVHFREPGLEWKEDLESGSRAAVLGGVVAVFEMPNTEPTTTDPDSLADKLARARHRMHCDHAFYVGGTHENAVFLGELERLPGCCGIKVFMGASTGSLLVQDDAGIEQVLRHVNRRAAFHSEDEYRLAERRPLARTGDWTSHEEVRDAASALESTHRLVRIAKALGKRIHVLHVTTKEEMIFLAANKDVASVEVTPQHLTLTAPEAYERLKGYAQMNPPIRNKHHQDGLWDALAAGVADVLGSDHAPHTKEEKARPYPASPSGMPGVQTLVPVMLTHVANGRLSLERFVDLTSHGANRLFGMADKGRLAVGNDADFTIVDLKAKRVIKHEDMASRVGWTPFDGFEATGWPMATIIRGRVVMRDDEVIAPSLGEPVRFSETLGG